MYKVEEIHNTDGAKDNSDRVLVSWGLLGIKICDRKSCNFNEKNSTYKTNKLISLKKLCFVSLMQDVYNIIYKERESVLY